MRLISRALAACALAGASLAVPLAGSPPVLAQDASGTVVYTGNATDSQTLIDTGVRYVDGCDAAVVDPDDPVTCFPDWFPGTLWFRVQAGINFEMKVSETAEFSLQAPDQFRQDTTAPFSTTLKAVDAAGNEVVVTATPWIEVDLAYDSPLANCPKSTIQNSTDLDNADTSGCLNAVLHDTLDLGTYDIFAKSLLLPYTGAASATDTKSSPSLDVGALVGFPGILKVRLDVDMTATMTAGTGYTATRDISASSGPPALVSGTINWPSDGPLADNVTVPCSAPVGDNLVYGLTANEWNGTGKLSALPKIVIDILGTDIPIPLGSPTTIFEEPVKATAAPDFTAVLGEILAENKPPVVGVITAPNGVEGSQIQFGVVATDNCGTPALRWDFSDGGVEFGATPQKAFNDGASFYSGQVTATDGAGNTAMKTFSLWVGNVNPTVNGGPDKSQLWGVPVFFTANGGDAGGLDRMSLLYTWDFDDPDSPIGAAGQFVGHTYATPGTYDAVVSVSDKDGGTGSDSVAVTIQKRGTTTTYTGDTSGQLTDVATLRATVVDQLNAPVAGRVVTFRAGGVAVATALTNSSGVATAPYVLTGAAGTRSMTAEIGEDGLYLASLSAGVDLVVAQETSVLTNTGVLQSAPSKQVPVSATLKDDDGTPIVGASVAFTLGSQGCNGTTNASGVVTCTVPKLTQKPGKYPFGITYAGSATYLPANWAGTFIINR